MLELSRIEMRDEKRIVMSFQSRICKRVQIIKYNAKNNERGNIFLEQMIKSNTPTDAINHVP